MQLAEPAGSSELDLRDEEGGAQPIARLPAAWPARPGSRPAAVEPLRALDRALGASAGRSPRPAGSRRLLVELDLAHRTVVIERALGDGPAVAELHETALDDLDSPHLKRLLPAGPVPHSRSLAGFLLAHAGLAGIGELADSPEARLPVEPARIERLPRFGLLPELPHGSEGERAAVAGLVRLVVGLEEAVRSRARTELERLGSTLAALRRGPEAIGEVPRKPGWTPEVEELLERYQEAQARLRRRTAELSVLTVERPRRLADWDELIQRRARLKALEQGVRGGPPEVCSRCYSQWPDGGYGCNACGEAESRPMALTEAQVALEMRLNAVQELTEQLDRDISLAEQIAERARSICTRIHHSLADHLLAHEVLGVSANGGGNVTADQHAELRERTHRWTLLHREEAVERLRRRLERLEDGTTEGEELRKRLEERIGRLHEALGEQTYPGAVGPDLLPDGSSSGPKGAGAVSRDGWMVWQLALFQELHESELAAPGLLVMDPGPGVGGAPAEPSVFERVNGRFEATLAEWLDGPGAGSQVVLVTTENGGSAD